MSDSRQDLSIQTLDRSPEEIEREIERTRDRMSTNFDELTDRLNPATLKRQAKEAVTGKAQDVVAELGGQVRTTATRVRDYVVRNPLAVTAVTLGALSLLVRRRSRRRIQAAARKRGR
jgi:hypothetical protein